MAEAHYTSSHSLEENLLVPAANEAYLAAGGLPCLRGGRGPLRGESEQPGCDLLLNLLVPAANEAFLDTFDTRNVSACLNESLDFSSSNPTKDKNNLTAASSLALNPLVPAANEAFLDTFDPRNVSACLDESLGFSSFNPTKDNALRTTGASCGGTLEGFRLRPPHTKPHRRLLRNLKPTTGPGGLERPNQDCVEAAVFAWA